MKSRWRSANWCWVSAVVIATSSWVSAATPTNVVVIFTDDHGYSDLSCQGLQTDIKTPHIDKLAAEGVRMTSGYVTAPQCVPSRAGLLSGQYQNRFGVESNGMPLDGFNAIQTVAERLSKAGYATGMIGKWHLGPSNQIVDHGFDDVFYQGGQWTNFALDSSDVEPGTRFSGMYHLDAKSAAARAFIERHHDEPFFLYLAYRAPHVPLDATQKYLDRFPGPMPERRRQALAMLSAVDDGVGGVMEALREHAIDSQTLVFFIGDNGAPLKIHKLDAPGGGPGWDGSLNEPLNGEKGMLSEGGIRVPFVVSWKGRIPGGQTYDHPVISLDVAATALALAGEPRDPELDGVNLVPYLDGSLTSPPHETLYWRWIAQAAVREGKWKYLRGGTREYLFDVTSDREEHHNLIAAHPDVALKLSRKLQNWASRLQPAGLETGTMSSTWEQYFDFYLDGKPAPPVPQSTREQKVQNWLIRNGSLELQAGYLRVKPTGRRKQPFIAQSRLNLPPGTTAAVRLRTRNAGQIGMAWREQGQADFAEGQSAKVACKGGNDWQNLKIELQSDRPIIHVRLLLPDRGADIAALSFIDKNGKTLSAWQFSAADKP